VVTSRRAQTSTVTGLGLPHAPRSSRSTRDADYDTFPDGKSRADGTQSFLHSRLIDVPLGEVGERAATDTIPISTQHPAATRGGPINGEQAGLPLMTNQLRSGPFTWQTTTTVQEAISVFETPSAASAAIRARYAGYL
jgi:hypothetical protein